MALCQTSHQDIYPGGTIDPSTSTQLQVPTLDLKRFDTAFTGGGNKDISHLYIYIYTYGHFPKRYIDVSGLFKIQDD